MEPLQLVVLVVVMVSKVAWASSLTFDPYPYADPDSLYPMSALQCYSSLTSPDNLLICPESRNKFCMKEVVAVREKLCGTTQYFGDVYFAGKCEFRKCARNCTNNEQINFYYPTHCKTRECKYTRTRYCCTESWCNAASSTAATGRTAALASSLLLALFMMWP